MKKKIIRPPSTLNSDNKEAAGACLRQIEHWDSHREDPTKAIDFHLSQTNEVKGLIEITTSVGDTVVCFENDDDDARKYGGDDGRNKVLEACKILKKS